MSDIVFIGNGNELSIGEKVKKTLKTLGGIDKIVRPGSLVLIKPNFVAPFRHATTSFGVLKAIVDEVRNCGGRPVIADSSGFEFDTEATFRILGAYEFAKRNNVAVVNLDKETYSKVTLDYGLVREIEVSRLALQADVIISIPKLKRHSLTKVSLGVKNLFGLLSRASRRRIHATNLELGIFAVSQVIKPDLVVVDGSTISSSAVYGSYSDSDIIVAGTDVYSVDMFCCRFLHVDHQKVKHLKIALNKGIVTGEFRVIHPFYDGTEKMRLAPCRANSDSLSQKVLRFMYQFVYSFDTIYSRVLRGKTIIPFVHFYFGVRPYLDKKKCTDCGDCVPACPVNAISIPERKINAKRCMPVRCMKCISACPEKAIRIRGRKVYQLRS